MKELLMILATLTAQEVECDSVHGVGCIADDRGRCTSCAAAIEQAFSLCGTCAGKEGRCVCGKRKHVHGAVGTLETGTNRISLVCEKDVYGREISAVPKNFLPNRKEREDGKFEHHAIAGADEKAIGKTVYVRFAKVDVAGGPPGKYEMAMLARRIRILFCTVVATEPALKVEAKETVRLFEAACKGCGVVEAVEVASGRTLEIPSVSCDHGFFLLAEGGLKSGTMLFRDGAWTLDGRTVRSPFGF